MNTREEIKEYLQGLLNELHIEAESNRSVLNMGQGVGALGFVAGSISCFGLPFIGLPVLAVGSALYAFSTIVETITTGECTPIPFMATRFQTMAMKAAQEKLDIDDDDLDVLYYLGKRDRALYLLIMSQDEKMAELLCATPQTKWNATINTMIAKSSKVLKGTGTQLNHHNINDLASGIIQREMKEEIKPDYIKAAKPSYVHFESIEVPIESEVVFKDVEVVSNGVKSTLDLNTKSHFDFTPPNKEAEILANIKDIVERNNSYFVAGSKGAGKAIMTSNIIRWKLEQYPNAQAFILDPKGSSNEEGYWNHPRIKVFSFKGISLSTSEIESKVIEFLEQARRLISQADILSGRRLFLGFDELLFLKANLPKDTFSEVVKFCSNTISIGDSEGIHSIAITQSFNASDSLGNDELLKNLCLIGVFREDEFTRVQKVIQYGRTNSDKLTLSDFKGMVSQSSRNRVCCVGGEFFASPEMDNFSGFDRDAGKLIKDTSELSDPLVDELVSYIKLKGLTASNLSVDKIMGTSKAKAIGITESQVKRALELSK